MHFPASRGLWSLTFVPVVLSQTYGDDYLTTSKDSDIVAAAFPDVEGIELIAPAFTKPESLPAGWSNGTEGPTDLFELGNEFEHHQSEPAS